MPTQTGEDVKESTPEAYMKVRLCLDRKRDSAVVERSDLDSQISSQHDRRKRGERAKGKPNGGRSKQVETERSLPFDENSPEAKIYNSLGSSKDSLSASGYALLTENSIASHHLPTEHDEPLVRKSISAVSSSLMSNNNEPPMVKQKSEPEAKRR